MQAIQTRFYPATNYRGARIKASCQARSRFYSWNDARNQSDNHTWAAKALATELGWNYGKWIGGSIPDGSTVFVCEGKNSDETFTVEAEAA